MENRYSDQTYQSLVIRYLSGNASDIEVSNLESWVADSVSNKRQFLEIKKAWLLSGMAASETTVDADRAWQKTAELLQEGRVVQIPKSNNRRWLMAAASLLILSIVSFLLVHKFNDPNALVITTTTNEKGIDLSDGSHISLNQSSSLTYLLDEQQQQRKASLVGDAFFDVARDEKKPFIIETKHLEIEVLGTSFYVDARSDEDEVQVIVESGSVAVRANNKETILTADEKIVFNKKGASMVKQKNHDVNFTALKTKTLMFENDNLRDVVFALNRQFDVNIRLHNSNLADCVLTSTFKNKSLDTILTIIKSTLGINIRQTQNQIIFEGNCTLE